jgi:cytochrome c553
MANPITFIVLVLLVSGCVTARQITPPFASDMERGAQLFAQGQRGAPPCSACHQVVAGQLGFSIGPNLAEIAERAAARVEGLSAQEYLRQSIVAPHYYVVSGYRDIMYPDYGARLTEQDIQDLLAYLLTL